MSHDLKSYVEKARDDFKRDAKEGPAVIGAEAFNACAQRLDAILDRVEEEQANVKLVHGGNILEYAHDIIHGDRLKHYGHPSINFERIATSWSRYLGKDVSPMDVCVMMILLKAQRMAEGYHRDSAIDIAGYAALAAIVVGDDEL